MSSSKILRPIPRRPSPLDSPQNSSSPLLSSGLFDESPSRTHSILNLTSSTLGGIFSPTVYDSEQENNSNPGGTGILTPHNSSSFFRAPVKQNNLSHPHKKTRILDLGLRLVLLFVTGMCYGLLIQNLRDKPQIFLFEVENHAEQKICWISLFLWGTSGVVFGSLLPRVDTSFYFDAPHARNLSKSPTSALDEDIRIEENSISRRDWAPVIRSVGAFVGIAFALRKLPWTSTFQASLALCLVNPVLWYLIDCSKSGFFLSSAVGTIGTALLLLSKAEMKIYPALKSSMRTFNPTLFYGFTEKRADLDFLSKESLEEAIWMLSVLFCSCICFGNIGRRLALNIRE